MHSKKETHCFEDELLKISSESDVWKKISAREDLNWSETLLDSYADQLDWEMLSENVSIPWTESLLEKYLNRIHWERLPSNTFNCFLHRSRMKTPSYFKEKELNINSLVGELLLELKCRNTFKQNESEHSITSRRTNSQRDLLLNQLGLTPLASLDEVLEVVKERYYR